MYNIPDDYEFNEKDIASTIKWLGFVDPQNANPDNAIDFLIFLRTVVHQEWHEKSKDLERSYKEYIANKR